jgi:DNA-binding transcriptional LysR family regulator
MSSNVERARHPEKRLLLLMVIAAGDDDLMWEPRHLAALDAVARTGTFGRAAVELGYTQSSLSQQIAALERAVGGRLFDRLPGARPPQLTPLGRLVLEEGRSLLARQGRASDAVDRYLAGGGRVDVGTFQTVTNELLPDVVRQVREDHPDARILLSEDETDSPTLDGLDLLFFDGDGPPGAQRAEVFRDDHVLITPTGLLAEGRVDLAELHGRPMVALPALCDQAMVEQALAAASVVPDIVFRTADNQGVTAMVRAGLGVAVMPLLAVAGQQDDPGLTFHALRPALPERLVDVWWRGSLSPLATRFRDVALEVGVELTRRGRVRG